MLISHMCMHGLTTGLITSNQLTLAKHQGLHRRKYHVRLVFFKVLGLDHKRPLILLCGEAESNAT